MAKPADAKNTCTERVHLGDCYRASEEEVGHTIHLLDIKSQTKKFVTVCIYGRTEYLSENRFTREVKSAA